MSRRRPASRALGAALLALSCGACTTVYIKGPADSISVERYFGFAAINVDPSKGAVVADLESLGFSASPVGYAVGFGHQSVVMADANCRLVLWIKDASQLEAINQKIGAAESVCTNQAH